MFNLPHMSQVLTGGVVKDLLAQPIQHFSVVPNQFSTRHCFHGRQFPTDQGRVDVV